MSQCIAERNLFFSLKGSNERSLLIIRIFAPRKVVAGDVDFDFAEGTAVCVVQFQGLSGAEAVQIYDADTVQALQLASDVDSTLERWTKKYDFYFPSGENYFESE